jgi:hypothetical protein
MQEKILALLLLYLLTGDGQNNENSRQYRNKTICVGCIKRTSVIFSIILLFVYVCSASVIALQMVFSNSLCESAAKWETCQIFKEDRLLVHV